MIAPDDKAPLLDKLPVPIVILPLVVFNDVHVTAPPETVPVNVPVIFPDAVISLTDTILPVPNVKLPFEDVANDAPVIAPFDVTDPI